MKWNGDYILPSVSDSRIAMEFYKSYNESVTQNKINTRKWIEDLMLKGIRASHPDDGWVNRQINEVQLCYPDFNMGLQEGDKIALGTYREYRVVTIQSIRKSFCGGLTYYKFTDRGGEPWKISNFKRFLERLVWTLKI